MKTKLVTGLKNYAYIIFTVSIRNILFLQESNLHFKYPVIVSPGDTHLFSTFLMILLP